MGAREKRAERYRYRVERRRQEKRRANIQRAIAIFVLAYIVSLVGWALAAKA
nr:hypothetical protein [Flavonifractor sp. An135]